MKKNPRLQLLLVVFGFLEINAFVISRIYNPSRFAGYLITTILFLLLIIWISLVNPLNKLPTLQRKLGFFKLCRLAVMIGFMLSVVVIQDIERVLGGLALVPLNLFSALLCLMNPIPPCKSPEK